MSSLRVMVVGLGPIGLACAQAVAVDRSMRLTGLVDIDPAKVGRTLGQLGGRGEWGANGPRVTDDLLLAAADGAAVAVVTTASGFDKVAPTVEQLLEMGVAVVSSCEEMIWPWYRHPDLAGRVDDAARRAGRAVLGTGVNPGFVMDSLVVALSSMVRRVARVHCVRRVDASLRRHPLQAKVGATLTPQAFHDLAREGGIGHKGLAESLVLLAVGLGRSVEPDAVVETLEPVLADRPIHSALGLVEPGNVCGIHNVARWQDDTLAIELDLTMAVGLSDPRDTVNLHGPVQMSLTIPGSVPGDSATVAVLLNHLRVVHDAPAGLRTALDLPIAGCHGRDA